MTCIRVGLLRTLIALVAGCSTHRLAEKSRLPWHPIHETRLTNQPTPGYVATGVWRVRGASNTVYLAGASHVVADEEISRWSRCMAWTARSGPRRRDVDGAGWAKSSFPPRRRARGQR